MSSKNCASILSNRNKNFLLCCVFDTGDMFAHSWAAVESLVRPYPGTLGIDVTDEMVNQVGFVFLTRLGLPKFLVSF